MIEAVVYSDGSRLNEAGPVGWACQVIVGEKDKPAVQRYEQSGQLASASVLLAELYAAFVGVELALKYGAQQVIVYTDAANVIDLVTGKHRYTRPDTTTIAIIESLQNFATTVEIRWVWNKAHLKHGSGGNNRADYLARQALLTKLRL